MLYNVKQYNLNTLTASLDMHIIANAKPYSEAHKIMVGAMNTFSDAGWYIHRCVGDLLEVSKGDERIKVILKEIN